MLHKNTNIDSFVSEYHKNTTTSISKEPQRYYARRYKINQVRNLLIYLMYLNKIREGKTNYCRELAPLFGVDHSIIARAIKSISHKIQTVERLYETTGVYNSTKFTVCYYELYFLLNKISKNEST